MDKKRDLEDLQKKIGYSFRDRRLLLEALTHSSFSNENPEERGENNERLEFLGDAVLDLAAAEHLSDLLPGAREGELSRQRSLVVNEKSLAGAARGLDLGGYLLLGKGEERSGGRDKQSILAGGIEALVGAVHRDGGWEAARGVVHAILAFTPKMAPGEALRDPKTRLQEVCQEEQREFPQYRLLSREGPDHQPSFTVAVSLGGRDLAEGRGGSKKEAEQDAAGRALEKLERS
jgi:ribonuclease-3